MMEEHLKLPVFILIWCVTILVCVFVLIVLFKFVTEIIRYFRGW